jgi:hypothetical protein
MSYIKKMSRFSLRTKVKVNIQWILYCIVHNIEKCMSKMTAASGGDEGIIKADRQRQGAT